MGQSQIDTIRQVFISKWRFSCRCRRHHRPLPINCLRRRELNARGEKRKAVKTRKQPDTQTYLVKWTNREQKLGESYT